MGTMRNNFAAVFVPLILMLSTGQSRTLHGNENSSKRNSLPNTLTREPGSTSVYECLFVDPNLPICDVELMLNSDEDSTRDQNFSNREVKQRSRRNVDTSAMDVIVYTIEGCLPPRLPFTMPTCEGISLDRVVDIQKFRPFVVKGVTKPPLVFPKFNYPRWLRMMTRLRNHVASKTRDETQLTSAANRSVHGLTEELMNAATAKETIPNAMAASMNRSKGSSSNRLISEGSKFAESVKKIREAAQDASKSKPRVEFKALPSPPVVNSSLQSHDKVSVTKLRPNRRGDRTKPKIFSQGSYRVRAAPEVPKDRLVYDRPAMEEPSNRLPNYENSEKSLELPPGSKLAPGDKLALANAGVDDRGIEELYALLPTKDLAEAFRTRREIRLPVSAQGIEEETKERGVAHKSISRRVPSTKERSSSTASHFGTSISRKQKQSKSLKTNQQGIAIADDVQKIAVAGYSRESALKFRNKNSHDKIDALAGSKATWRKTVSKETAPRKKYPSHRETPSSRNL